MNMTSSGYPSSYQCEDVSKYYTQGNDWHNTEHLPQIQRMVEDTISNLVPQIINEQVPQVVAEIMRQTIPSMIGAIETDITTIVSIAFEQANDIFTDKRTQAYISSKIMNELEKRLTDITFTITL